MRRGLFGVSFEPVLAGTAAVHAAVGLVALVLLLVEAPPILGVHPALKPMKFGLSIAVFLSTMAVLLPSVALGPDARRVVAWTLAACMVAEMVPIAVQALRGTTSHFNRRTPLDTALWKLMGSAIAVATAATVLVALVATVRPLQGPGGAPMPALLATAWRAGLWFFVLAAFTGARMGAQLAHAVGGADGGPGLPVVNWSTQHGDLRIAHFVGLHAMQALPLAGAALVRAPLGQPARWTGLLALIALHLLVAGWTTWRALAGRPPW